MDLDDRIGCRIRRLDHALDIDEMSAVGEAVIAVVVVTAEIGADVFETTEEIDDALDRKSVV